MSELFRDILDAHRAIRPQVPVTALERSPILSRQLGCEVLLKHDHMQPTGSFKIRGATNKIRLLQGAARTAGVFAASTGNHGIAVARAGAQRSRRSMRASGSWAYGPKRRRACCERSRQGGSFGSDQHMRRFDVTITRRRREPKMAHGRDLRFAG
jgi:hypothetical protein